VTGWAQCIVTLDRAAMKAGWSGSGRRALWTAHDLMAELFAGRYRGSGRPFMNHLAGTAALALDSGAGEDEVVAGYAHAAYEQGEFGRPEAGASEANRAELRRAIGADAEEIVHRYATLPWFSRLPDGPDAVLAGAGSVERSVLLLRACNALDDALDYHVHAEDARRIFRDELEASAQIAEAMGRAPLAARIRARLQEIAAENPPLPEAPRRKGSSTVRNRAWRRDPVLALARKARRQLG
jgi:(p)ppGpp synthase/HD superfamily hydrolase